MFPTNSTKPASPDTDPAHLDKDIFLKQQQQQQQKKRTGDQTFWRLEIHKYLSGEKVNDCIWYSLWSNILDRMLAQTA